MTEHESRLEKIAVRRLNITLRVKVIDKEIADLSKERFTLLEEGCDLWEEKQRRDR